MCFCRALSIVFNIHTIFEMWKKNKKYLMKDSDPKISLYCHFSERKIGT